VRPCTPDPPGTFQDPLIPDTLHAPEGFSSELLSERRAQPGSDLLSQLALAEEEGDKLSEGELLSTAILLLGAGHETTANLVGEGILALLDHRDQLERLREDPSLTRSGVEELMRYVSPVQLTGRVLIDDLPVGDKELGKGAVRGPSPRLGQP